MADSGASVNEFNMFMDNLLTGNSQPSVVSSAPDTAEEKPSGEARTSSTTNLTSAYLNLPHHLKSCLDYCYFVLDNVYNCEKHKLGCLLLAEDLIKLDRSNSLKEDVASAVIDQLISIGMLEKDSFDYEWVRIPSSCKKLGIWREDKRNLFVKTRDSSIRLFFTEWGIEVDRYPNLFGLSVTSLFDRQYWYNNCIPRAYMETICKLKSLEVLDLKGDIECLPDEIGDLVHLKYLSLTYEKRNYMLGTLDIYTKKEFQLVFSHMDELPIEEFDIQRLWHLMMSRRTFNSKAGVPMKVGLRLNLHTLAPIDTRGGIMSELSKFSKLRKLEIYRVTNEHAAELCAAIMNMSYLISLSVQVETEEFALFPELEGFSPPSRLQELSLMGQLVDIPTWLLSMENLSSLKLYFSCLDDNSIFLLQFLPNLKFLNLFEASNAKQIGEEFCQAGGFPKLETLDITSRILVEWSEIANGAFPSLTSLSFSYCKKLIFLPDGLQKISTLSELYLIHMHGDLERRLQGMEKYKIKHIPKIVFESG